MKKTIYPKLPKRFKEKWLIALRSGEYNKGRYSLSRNKEYCCLGVACHIQGVSDERMVGMAGIPEHDFPKSIPRVLKCGNEEKAVGKLMNLNDDVGRNGRTLSFKQIANWIEKNL